MRHFPGHNKLFFIKSYLYTVNELFHRDGYSNNNAFLHYNNVNSLRRIKMFLLFENYIDTVAHNIYNIILFVFCALQMGIQSNII